MVNTFLPYPLYTECARVLDSKRLGKQRVEARQILTVLEDLQRVARALGYPETVPKDVEPRSYIRTIASSYRSLSHILVEDTRMGTISWHPKDQVTQGRQDYQKTGNLRILKLGWVHHRATAMWIDHLDSLRLYLFIMIQEWIRRGFRNTMPLPTFSSSSNIIPDPPWIGRLDIHYSHQANLLRKDPQHYKPIFLPSPPKETHDPSSLRPSFYFPNLHPGTGYVWPH